MLSPEPSPHPSHYLENTWNGFGAIQVFDITKDGLHIIPPAQAAKDGPRYTYVWGVSTPQMTAAWQTNNPRIGTGYYIAFFTDARTDKYGDLGHDLTWWQANHPDYVLYECDKATPAWVHGLPAVPLDPSNPAVITYQMHVMAAYAEANGYSSMDADILSLTNDSGGSNGGSRGCGVWSTDSNGHRLWVQKFSGQPVDSAWSAAAVNWTARVQTYLHGLARPLALAGNFNAGSYSASDPTATSLVDHLDLVLDESGFSHFGNGFVTDLTFNRTVSWARSTQAHGQAFLVVDEWPKNQTTLTKAQLSYALATYLMGKEQASAMFTAPYGTYGQEHYYSEYQAAIGVPCAEMYGGPTYQKLGQYVYYRQFANALAVVNTSAASAYTVNLPQATYTDLVTGSKITSPFSVPRDSGYVLMAQNGCR